MIRNTIAPEARLAICAAARQDRRLNPTTYVVLSCILDATDEESEISSIFQADIAAEIGVNVATVERAVKQLSEAGWLVIERKGLPKRNHYYMRPAFEMTSGDLS